MRYVPYNPNPIKKNAGDCVIRMLTLAADESWAESYSRLALKGLEMGDMPSANIVWMEELADLGFQRYSLPSKCPYCYTIDEFCRDHPRGFYVLGTGTHVVSAIDGKYYDSWDSGNEILAFIKKKIDSEE